MSEATKKVREKQLARLLDYKKCFGSPEGERVLYDMMSRYGMLRSSFSKDALEMAFNEGQRNVVLTILTILETDYETLRKKVEAANEAVR